MENLQLNQSLDDVIISFDVEGTTYEAVVVANIEVSDICPEKTLNWLDNALCDGCYKSDQYIAMRLCGTEFRHYCGK